MSGRLRISSDGLDAEGADAVDALFGPEERRLIEAVHESLGERRRALLSARGRVDPRVEERVVEGTWEVAPAPPGLERRHVEITGPPEPRMAAHALASGADVWMGDLEDSTAPTWANIVRGHGVLRGALTSDDDTGPTVVARPRGLHLLEHAVTVDGEPVAAAVVDTVLWAVGAHREGAALAPYVYVPKMESAAEAGWWADLFRTVDGARADGFTTRASILIETLPAALQMDAILHALREHACALNAGRWDYLFSAIKRRPAGERVLPDRAELTMQTPFLRAYAEQIVARAHRRGAHAIGGMAAAVPSRRDPEQTARAIERVREDKQREAGQGFDGSWVAHPDLVPVCAAVFGDALGSRPHQIRTAAGVPHPAADLLAFDSAGGSVTTDGVRANVRVALEYLRAWYDGRGAIAISGLMEDAATAEIARAQLWEWSRSDAGAPAGTGEEIARLIDEESAAWGGVPGPAPDALRRLVFADHPPEFFPESEAELLRSVAATR